GPALAAAIALVRKPDLTEADPAPEPAQIGVALANGDDQVHDPAVHHREVGGVEGHRGLREARLNTVEGRRRRAGEPSLAPSRARSSGRFASSLHTGTTTETSSPISVPSH